MSSAMDALQAVVHDDVDLLLVGASSQAQPLASVKGPVVKVKVDGVFASARLGGDVEGDDLDAHVAGFFDQVIHGGVVDGVEQDGVHTLGQEVLDTGTLCFGRVLGVQDLKVDDVGVGLVLGGCLGGALHLDAIVVAEERVDQYHTALAVLSVAFTVDF